MAFIINILVNISKMNSYTGLLFLLRYYNEYQRKKQKYQLYKPLNTQAQNFP